MYITFKCSISILQNTENEALPETKTIYTEDSLALSSVYLTDDFRFSIATIFVARSAHREIARIASILKNGAKDDRSNYGPISILPFATRLFL